MKPTRFTPEMVNDYLLQKYWDGGDTITQLSEITSKYGNREAIVDSGGSRLTWQDIDLKSDIFAIRLLNSGLQRDDLAIVQLPNIADSIIVRLGLQKAGLLGVYVPLTLRSELNTIITRLHPAVFIGLPSVGDKIISENELGTKVPLMFTVAKENFSNMITIATLLTDTGKNITDHDALKKTIDRTKILPFDVSFILLTSGSTGSPKFCEWPEQPIRLYARTVIDRMQLTTDDVFGLFAPLNGGVGLTLWLAALFTGSKCVLLEKFDPSAALSIIQQEKITVTGVVPTQAIKMAKSSSLGSFNVGSLRAMRVGGAKLGYEEALRIERRLGCKIICAAGIADAMSIGHTHIGDPEPIRLATVGKPWRHNEIRLVTDEGSDADIGQQGEVWVRGACTASGYFGDPSLTEATWGVFGIDGWCRTGDLGTVDEDGNLTLIGRKKDIIIRGGQNIYPEEVEAILASHTKIFNVVVIPMHDEELGERACACITPKGGERITYSEMVSFLEDKGLAIYKYPERLIIVDSIPTVNEDSKINRRALRREVEQELSGCTEWRTTIDLTMQ